MTITGDLKSKIDNVWDAFWVGGIANPLEVMEQLTYLLFIKGLNETQTREESNANRTGKPIERPILPDGDAPTARGPALEPVQGLRGPRDVRGRRQAPIPLPSRTGRRQHACGTHRRCPAHDPNRSTDAVRRRCPQ